MQAKEYIVVVQCDIVMDRCSGYLCEKSFNERTGGFSIYPKDQSYRTLYLTCGGCCGRAAHRKLGDLINMIKKHEEVPQDRIAVHLASCITKENFHGPKCPHLDYLKELIAGKKGLDLVEDTYISKLSEKRRQAGKYAS